MTPRFLSFLRPSALFLCVLIPALGAPPSITGISFSASAPADCARLLFPAGRPKAVTMSFDDATTKDRRLVRLFNAYGIRGTFHVPLSTINMEGYITTNELKALYAGHEVSIHDGNTYSPTNEYRQQIITARDQLAALLG